MEEFNATPGTLAELREMLLELDTAISFGASWMTTMHEMEVEAVRGRTRWTLVLTDSGRVELRFIERGTGLAVVNSWQGSDRGMPLPPNMARKVWELAEVKRLAHTRR